MWSVEADHPLPIIYKLIYLERTAMGDKGGKKDKEKAKKQKVGKVEKQKEEKKTKLPVKKIA